MLYEFQVIYRLAPSANGEAVGAGVSWPAISGGPLHALVVRAENELQAKRLIAAPGLTVVSVGPAKPILPEKPTLNLEEAAAYLDVSERTLRDLQAKGELPRPTRGGHTVFRIEEVEDYRCRAMQLGERKTKVSNP